MHKRQFLAAAAVAASAPVAARAPADRRGGPGLLTAAGAVGRSNRAPLNSSLDQLLVKHGAAFERAWVYDSAQLARLPVATIEPTLEYDARPHTLSGPRLGAVLALAGVAAGAQAKLLLRAVDGYTVTTTLADVHASAMIVATTLDGMPLALGGLGPLWAIHDADRLPALQDKPLNERFAGCPWGLYFIDVQPL